MRRCHRLEEPRFIQFVKKLFEGVLLKQGGEDSTIPPTAMESSSLPDSFKIEVVDCHGYSLGLKGEEGGVGMNSFQQNTKS